MIEIKFLKTNEDAILPRQNNTNLGLTNDSGYDLFAVEDVVIPSKGKCVVPVGLKLAYITPGYWFRVEARSGLSFKNSILPHNGIIDNGYRGDLGVLLYNHSDKDYVVIKGDKVAQIIVYPLLNAQLSFTDEVQETIRGEKGFGSSDGK